MIFPVFHLPKSVNILRHCVTRNSLTYNALIPLKTPNMRGHWYKVASQPTKKWHSTNTTSNVLQITVRMAFQTLPKPSHGPTQGQDWRTGILSQVWMLLKTCPKPSKTAVPWYPEVVGAENLVSTYVTYIMKTKNLLILCKVHDTKVTPVK